MIGKLDETKPYAEVCGPTVNAIKYTQGNKGYNGAKELIWTQEDGFIYEKKEKVESLNSPPSPPAPPVAMDEEIPDFENMTKAEMARLAKDKFRVNIAGHKSHPAHVSIMKDLFNTE